MKTFHYPLNHKEDEAYMARMCHQGWAATRLVEGVWTFEPCRPDQYVYRVGYLRGKSRAEVAALKAALAARGIAFVSRYSFWAIFRSEQDTRCYRMAGYGHWYNLDLPETIAVRVRLLPESGTISQIGFARPLASGCMIPTRPTTLTTNRTTPPPGPGPGFCRAWGAEGRWKGAAMDFEKDYLPCAGSRAAMILMVGSRGNNRLTRAVAKWLAKQKIGALCLGPEPGQTGYHSFPMERMAAAIAFLRGRGIEKIGVLGASITSIPVLLGAAMFPQLSLTLAFTPCDFVLQGFAQGRRDGCREWPVHGESMLTWQGRPLPCVTYAYQHPAYAQVVRRESRDSGNLIASRKLFADTEGAAPLPEGAMLPVERIRGRLMLIGCEDDCLWDTGRYIRRMEARLQSRGAASRWDALVYPHGTHFAFPESLLRQILPIGAGFAVGRVFRAAREYPRECRETRQDIDRRVRQALLEWRQEA